MPGRTNEDHHNQGQSDYAAGIYEELYSQLEFCNPTKDDAMMTAANEAYRKGWEHAKRQDRT